MSLGSIDLVKHDENCDECIIRGEVINFIIQTIDEQLEREKKEKRIINLGYDSSIIADLKQAKELLEKQNNECFWNSLQDEGCYYDDN
jgi:hypothetical protein